MELKKILRIPKFPTGTNKLNYKFWSKDDSSYFMNLFSTTKNAYTGHNKLHNLKVLGTGFQYKSKLFILSSTS